MPEKQQRIQTHILRFYKIMLVVFTVLMLVSRFNKGVRFGAGLLKAEPSGTETRYSGEALIHGRDLAIRVYPSAENETVVEYTLDGSSCLYRVQYPLETVSTKYGGIPGIRILKDDVILFNGAYSPEKGWFDWRGEWSPSARAGGFNERDALYFAQGPELTARGDWKLFLTAVGLTLLFMLCTAHPEELFKLRHSRFLRRPEPTALWYTRQSVFWCIELMAALLTFIFALFTIP